MAEKEKILFGEPCYKIRTLEEKKHTPNERFVSFYSVKCKY